jgi:octaheme c-type cytochrome (tetrathionate reductase family)
MFDLVTETGNRAGLSGHVLLINPYGDHKLLGSVDRHRGPIMKTPGVHWHILLLAVLLAALDAVAEPAMPVKSFDHSSLKALQQEFKSGPEVTRACLGCHAEAAKQIQRTQHWSWEFLNPESGQRLGKRYVINNFCVAAASNYAVCTSCHVGYGWKDEKFDFSSQENVDCLVCHDTTGSYRKPAGLAGHPAYKEMELPPGSGKFVKAVDLQKVAQHVGKTSRDTCGACHFFGGGGDGVKHGDMDSSLAAPDRKLDVHMDATGADFTCATCHMTAGHQVPGSRYVPTAADRDGRHVPGRVDNTNPGTCQACHGNEPHEAKVAVLNKHANKLACQVCHIPAMARGDVATLMTWDWSTAGKMGADGKPMQKKNAKGRVIYDSKEGDFTVGENVMPEYVWFNGKIRYTLLGDKVDKAAGIVQINRFEGSPNDGKSVIWPVKVFRGVQPYDPVNKTLVIPHTTGVDDASYWKNFNWEKAIAAGMASVGAPFSGKVDFIRTEMTWPLNHMVAPKENALACNACHRKDGGRLKGLKGLKILPSAGKLQK